MNTRQMTITPELAKQFLTRNTNNRSVRKTVVKRYARDMLEGNFILMPHGIVFLKDGSLADGQHRLLAIINSNTTQEMMVTFDADPSIHLYQDRGDSRTEYDNLRINGNEWSSKNIVAMLKLCLVPEIGEKTISISTLSNVDERTVEIVSFVENLFSGNRKYLTNAAVKSALVLALHSDKSVNRKDLAHFSEVLISGHGNGDCDSPIITLRNRLLNSEFGSRGSEGREEVLRLTQACLKCFLDKKPIKRAPKHDELIWQKIKLT